MGIETADACADMVSNPSKEETTGLHAYADDGTQNSLRRLFSFIQLLAFALTFMSSWEVMAMNMGATFANGGPSSLSWGILLVILGSLFQALSMAEMASVQPIAGAQYHWTFFLAPEGKRRFITWMQGWVTWFAWVSALAGSSSSLAFILQGLISTNYSTYEPKSWHNTLLIIAILVFSGLVNTFAFQTVPWLELLTGILHVLLWFVFVGVLLGMQKEKSTASFVFLESSGSSGWESNFVRFNLGMLVPAWGFIGFDGVVHMSEEVRKAKQAVPRAMILTIVINGALAYGVVLALLYAIGSSDSLSTILESGYPVIPLCITVTHSTRAGTAMVAFLVIITFCVVIASLASVSRITWAWARDDALPKWFAKVDPRYRVPIRSLWLPVGIVCLLSLLNVGSTSATAFSAFTALSSLGLYTSYIVAISCMLHARLTGRIAVPSASHPNPAVSFGGFKMWNGWGGPVNVAALIWTVYLTIWLPFPLALPVVGSNMNYAAPIYGMVLLGSLGWWFIHGRRNWAGLNQMAIDKVEKE